MSLEEHILSANLSPPRPTQLVYKDDCSYCFDTPVCTTPL